MLVHPLLASMALLSFFAAVAQVCATPNRDSASMSIAGIIYTYHAASGNAPPTAPATS